MAVFCLKAFLSVRPFSFKLNVIDPSLDTLLRYSIVKYIFVKEHILIQNLMEMRVVSR